MNRSDAIEILKKATRSIPDYPKKGIVFRDLTTIFQDGDAFALAMDQLILSLSTEGKLMEFGKFVGIEARGFVLAGGLAAKTGAGVVLLRKPGKLPFQKKAVKYTLEYGEDALEIHNDAIRPGEKVVIVDDILATGGTAEAACQLVEELGGEIVMVLFLVELPELNGKEKLTSYKTDSVFSFEGH